MAGCNSKTDALKIAGKGSKCMEDMIAKAKKTRHLALK